MDGEGRERGITDGGRGGREAEQTKPGRRGRAEEGDPNEVS